ncbi:TPA: LysM peptidoglycan-binding domain-containing protein [Bacillus thuringiensis]|nr:LysM domain-containing protein [Bacillus thuringiensis]RUR59431.1 LysM domain-containing protein [Bacillus sp. VKPM B-3276]MRA99104.1 LysM peptidoglycan-binding domain-containing protein [Bacillus thuringiensis]RNG36107.1 LysM domain-containing protein [Bacillus thuringiensis]UEL01009.1 LysM peptidoglycan-binding domain-containing protein [Bacillus thuringiensis]HDR3451564.1 LysM peptidoglycan-binding domain-containing protein [Bacillus thuringiensis]
MFKKDTLWDISKQYGGGTVQSIKQTNQVEYCTLVNI